MDGRKKSPPNMIDITNQTFGSLTVIERAGKTKTDNALWRCRCDLCGNDNVIARGTTLRRGEITSCGCDKKERMDKVRAILQNEMTIDGVSVPKIKQKVRADSGTGKKGVTRRNRKGRVTYEAYINVKGKRIYGGEFANESDALAARERLEKQYFDPIIEKYEQSKKSSED